MEHIKKILMRMSMTYSVLMISMWIFTISNVNNPLFYQNIKRNLVILGSIAIYIALTMLVFEIEKIGITRQILAHGTLMIPVVYIFIVSGFVRHTWHTYVSVTVIYSLTYTWTWFLMSIFWRNQAEEINNHLKTQQVEVGWFGIKLLYKMKEKFYKTRIILVAVTMISVIWGIYLVFV